MPEPTRTPDAALTPRELGVLAGLADKWGANPYPQGRTTVNREHDAYDEGFWVGQALLRIVEKDGKP